MKPQQPQAMIAWFGAKSDRYFWTMRGNSRGILIILSLSSYDEGFCCLVVSDQGLVISFHNNTAPCSSNIGLLFDAVQYRN